MWAVRLEEVTKRYRKGAPRYKSVGSDLSGLARRIGRRSGRSVESGRVALDDVSFEVGQGEAFGLVGANGAGKSTALRLISRISYPSSGRVLVRGRVGALIEVNSGVHFELSGRENIWLYGSILGLSRSDIRRRFDDIVAFSELEASIDMPVKYYSSGMQLRLGFSIASHLQPDVFVVDEALSVGDVNFQSRCVDRMSKLVREGTTLLFVSHHLAAIESMCQRAVMLEDGRVVADGTAKSVLATYITAMEEQRIDLAASEDNSGVVRIVAATCHDLEGRERRRLSREDGLEVRLTFESDAPIERPHVIVGITDGRPGLLIECSMLDDGAAPESVGRRWECRCVFPELPLRPRAYQVWCDVYAADGHGRLMEWMQVTAFTLDGPIGSGPKAVVNAATAGALDLPYRWEVTPDIDAAVRAAVER